jgi:hypothetical protein
MARGFGPLLTLVAVLAISACARPAGGSQSPAVGPTPVPEPPSVQNLPGRGIQVDGQGTTQTEDLVPQYAGGLTIGIDVVTLTHDGRSSFIVTAVQGDQSELVTSAIGAYRGQRPLVVEGPVSFHVTADGAWSLKIQPLSNSGTPNFSGSGDAVSAYFNPPAPTTWSISHDGTTSFLVSAHCLGGSVVVESATGAVQDTPRIEFARGPCFWEVRGDGAWSLQPQ